MNAMKTWTIAVWVAATGVLAGCQSPEVSGDLPATPEVAESTARYRKEYVIVPGDGLEVVVRQHPEVSRACVVRPDGFITLPLVDDVMASGLSFPELDRSLTESLAKHIQTPDVAVIATTVRPATVYVMGEVNTQGPVTLRDASTAVQAIAHAGGFKTSAKTDSIVVIRLVEDRITAIRVNFDLTGQPAVLMAMHNVVLTADDIVFVPKSYIAQIGDWLNDYINRPLTGVTGIVGLYTNYKLIETLE